MRLKYLLFTISLSVVTFFNAQDWKVENKPSKAFIENKGQFKSNNIDRIGGIDFAVDYGSTRIFFGKKGVSFDFVEAEKKSREEREEIMAKEVSSVAEHKEKERLFGKFMYKFDDLSFVWENAQSELELVGLNEFSDYHSYSFEDKNGETVSVNKIKGYEKIRYKNIYPGIDIEYTIHPQSGVKYALYLQPNADPNKIAMTYDREIEIKNGTVHIPTVFGDILDHAPITFYEGDIDNIIESNFDLEDKTVSFKLGEYNSEKPIVIDPWVQTPSFNNDWNCIWEVEYDAAGNVYAIGGTMPMKLQKFDPNGNIQWTHNTPYDTTSWLGGFGTDDNGTSYVTQGSVNSIQRVDNNGNVIWTNNGGTGTIGDSDEYWNVQFNCDESKVIVGGTDGAFGLPPVLEGAIFEIDVNNGNQLSSQVVAIGSTVGIPPTVQEVRSLSASPDAKYYWLTHDSIGYINDNFDLCNSTQDNLTKFENDITLAYKNENYRYNNTGIMALKADENFLYVNRGDEVQKRDLQTLAVVASAPIPNGSLNGTFGGSQVENSGIDVDECGNIFVGSTDQVIEYDNNLNQINTFATSFRVYDVHVAPNGRIIAGGSTGTSNSNARDGYIQQWNVGACSPTELICCDANFCQEGPFCETDAPVTIEVSETGGTFSGPGVDPSTGVFDPAAAGVGTHTITYTLPCGSEEHEFIVDPCSNIDICEESNGDLTASGGTGPYDWDEEGTISTPITNSTECTNCGYTWTGINCVDGSFNTVNNCTSTGWVNYASGTTTNPPSSYPIQVTDSQGSTVVINDPNDIPACGTTTCTSLDVTITAQSDVSCAGDNDGSATASASNGNGNYTYTWTPGNLNGATQNNLAAGSYTVDVVDTDGCDGSVVVQIDEPAPLNLTLSSTDATCGVNDGTAEVNVSGGSGTYSYSWSPGGETTANINDLGAGSYEVTVTDGNNCSETASVTVNSTNAPTITVESTEDVSCFGGDDGSAEVSASGGTPGYTFTWNPGSLTGAQQNDLDPGSYTVTVEDNDGCVNSTTLEINEPDEIILNTSSTPSSCTVDDGEASVSASGGSGSYTYEWSPNGETTSSISGVGAGIYTVEVTDSEGCTVSTNVNVGSVNGPIITVDNIDNISCAGEDDGAISISVSGGTAPFSYDWSPAGGNNPTAENLSPGTYTVTVTDDAGCISIEVIDIIETNPILIDESINASDCGENNGSIDLTVSGGSGTFNFDWSPNVSSGEQATNLSGGDYTVTITDGNGCSVTQTYTVEEVGDIDVFIIPESSTIFEDESVILSVETDPDAVIVDYSWSPEDGLSCTDCSNPVASPSDDIIYTVDIVTADGCEGSAQTSFEVLEACKGAFLPNIFSPNNDGNNDEFCVQGECVIGIELSIYNRWGERVYYSTDPDNCWRGRHRGKPVNSGVFVYKARINLINGDELFESGNITVIR